MQNSLKTNDLCGATYDYLDLQNGRIYNFQGSLKYVQGDSAIGSYFFQNGAHDKFGIPETDESALGFFYYQDFSKDSSIQLYWPGGAYSNKPLDEIYCPGDEPVCGNGEVENKESCDPKEDKQCSLDCKIKCDGLKVWDSEKKECVKEPVCGDGEVDTGETCDDGNVVDGDQCSLDCKNVCVEPEVWSGGKCGVCPEGQVMEGGVCKSPGPAPLSKDEIDKYNYCVQSCKVLFNWRGENTYDNWNITADCQDIMYRASEVSSYRLPYRAGQGYQVTQDICNATSHNSNSTFKYAYDFATPFGTEILAIESGVVLFVEEKKADWPGPVPEDQCYIRSNSGSNYIFIRQDNGVVARYVHMREDGVVVNVNDRVEKGQLIGYIGLSGYTCGYHLHLSANYGESYGTPAFITFGDNSVRNRTYFGVPTYFRPNTNDRDSFISDNQ